MTVAAYGWEEGSPSSIAAGHPPENRKHPYALASKRISQVF